MAKLIPRATCRVCMQVCDEMIWPAQVIVSTLLQCRLPRSQRKR
jgi:hypothetical protein